jgi:hypothetical protein
LDPKKNSGFDLLEPQKKLLLLDRVKKISKQLYTCGSTDRVSNLKKMTLPQFLYLTAQNAVKFGRFGAERIFLGEGEQKRFHSFRPIDIGTIYKINPRLKDDAQNIRKAAFRALEALNKEKLTPERLKKDIEWIQVINGIPQGGYSDEELCVYNCYPTTDVEAMGYPVSPIDTAVTAIMTHINISNHNKLYFKNGRAARGMVVLASDSASAPDASVLADMKLQFQATINRSSKFLAHSNYWSWQR